PMVESGLKAAGFKADPAVHHAFTHYRKSHNDGVFDAYTPEIVRCRRRGITTGLPDAYGRRRIIGDYRRVALYGLDRLIAAKREERPQADGMWPTDEVLRVREELAEQIRALGDLAKMGERYDCDLARPAETAREAGQWTYLGYLGGIRGASASTAIWLGRPRRPARPCNGLIWGTSVRSRRPTAPPCRSGAFQPSSTSSSSVT